MQKLHNIQLGRGRPELGYELDVMISVGYRVKSPEGVRFCRWATRVLREMLLNRLNEIKRLGSLERRMDAAESDLAQPQGRNELPHRTARRAAIPTATPPHRLRQPPRRLPTVQAECGGLRFSERL